MDFKWRNYVEKKVGSSHALKTELDKCLEDELLQMGEDEDNFDILTWWKTNGPSFPILARMAHDILAIPISTVASELSFSSGCRLISESKSSLSSDIVEGLSCIKDWLPSNIGHNVEFVDDASISL